MSELRDNVMFMSIVEAMRKEATRGFSATVIEHAMDPKNVGRPSMDFRKRANTARCSPPRRSIWR